MWYVILCVTRCITPVRFEIPPTPLTGYIILHIALRRYLISWLPLTKYIIPYKTRYAILCITLLLTLCYSLYNTITNTML